MRIFLFLGVLGTLMMSGCTYYVEQPLPFGSDNSGQAVSSQSSQPSQPNVSKEDMFVDSPDKSPTVLESRIEWSSKYESVNSRLKMIEEENRELKDKNLRLKNELDSTRSELEKAREELAQADEFMRKMNEELIKWKADVLGYRDENRRVQQAQVQALAKILKALGAEPIEPAMTDTEVEN